MKYILLIGFMLLTGMGAAFGQATVNIPKATDNPGDTTQWKINLLKEPTSPGASLLGISPSDVQKPADPSALMVSFLNATDNLSAIPNSYAVDFAPQWLFWGKNVTYKQFAGNGLWNDIKQTFDVSFALKNNKDYTTNITNTQLGIGLKTSLMRGQISAKTQKAINSVHNFQSTYNALRQKYIDSATKKGIAARMNPDQLRLVINAADQQARSDARVLAMQDSISKVSQGLDFSRTGFMLDLAGGVAYNFISQTQGKLYSGGVWVTGGQQWENGLDLLGIVRYLYDPQNAGLVPSATNYHTFDIGARLLYGPQTEKFSFGVEGIYRTVSGTATINSSYRYALTADYRIGSNQVITFNIGRDFDGTINKGGNLIAALNFLIGFGNSRPVQVSQ